MNIQNKIIQEVLHTAVISSSILIYFSSRVDPNFFKLVFIFFFSIVLIFKVRDGFNFSSGFVFFNFFVLFNVIFISDQYLSNIKTLAYFSIIYCSYYYYFEKQDLVAIINCYFNIAYFVSLVGIAQELLFLIDSEFLFYLSKGKNPDFWHFQDLKILRIASLLDEPSRLGMYILPAILLGFAKHYFRGMLYKANFFKLIIIFAAFILTFSAHAFLSLIISILIVITFSNKVSKLKKYVAFTIFMSVFPFILSQDAVSEKLINSGLFFNELDLSSSTIATSSLFYIGAKSIAETIYDFNVFGVGMGNYSDIAESHWLKIGMIVDDDGSTIGFARIMVEFGLIGIGLFFYFLWYCIIKSSINHDTSSYIKTIVVINHISALFIFTNLFRMGFYINPPTILFLALLSASILQYHKLIKI